MSSKYMPETPYDHTCLMSFEARFAAVLIERWGMVAAIEDGEDSAGRQKLRLALPQELAIRAVDTAVALTAELERREWIKVVPPQAKRGWTQSTGNVPDDTNTSTTTPS